MLQSRLKAHNLARLLLSRILESSQVDAQIGIFLPQLVKLLLLQFADGVQLEGGVFEEFQLLLSFE